MQTQYLRRAAAGAYLKSKYGFSSGRALAKLATVGGGPVFRKIGKIVVYTPEDLDRWAESKIGPARTSTSDRGEAA